MANIYYLNNADFGLEGGHMVANIGGLSFIMFHSQRCAHCVKFLPEFKTLPGTIRGVNFALCCVDDPSRTLIELSRNSSTPIKTVPKFILYNDGVPYIEYNLQRSRGSILNFLQDIIQKLDQKQSFTSRPRRTRQFGQEQQYQQQPQQQNLPRSPMPQQQAPPQQQPTGQMGQMGGGQMSQARQNTVITPTTGVKQYETSYGLPYNMTEQLFLDYQDAYLKDKH
jgi:hypothetical protein